MAALTAPRGTVAIGLLPVPEGLELPVAAGVVIYEGSIVVSDSLGQGRPATAATGLAAMGIALQTIDNRAGLAGSRSIRVQTGTFVVNNSTGGDAISAGDRGKLAYLVDDQTVALTDGGGLRSPAGKIYGVDARGVWVAFGTAPIYASSGSKAYTQLFANLVVPPSSGTQIPAMFVSTDMFAEGQTVVVSDGDNSATFEIVSIANGQSLTLRWTPAHTDCPGGTTIFAPGKVVPSGAAGRDGRDAYTNTTESLTIPGSPGGSVSVTVEKSDPLPVGACAFISDGASWGTFRVTASGSGSITLAWLDAPNDSSSGTVIASGAQAIAIGAPVVDALAVKRLVGSTPGLDPVETVELTLLDSSTFTLSPLQAYAIDITSTMGGTIVGAAKEVSYSAAIRLTTNGSGFINYLSVSEIIDDPQSVGWDMQLDQSVTTRVSIKATTGADAVELHASASAIMTRANL